MLNDPDAPVEQATAAPGEVRDLPTITVTDHPSGTLRVARYSDGVVQITFTPDGVA
jgi:hypothetical protein